MVPKRAWSHFLLAWSTATAMPKTGRECWENLHIARNKFEMQLKKNPPKLPKTLLIHNHINPVINTKNVSEGNENLPVLCVFCSLLANNYWKLVKKLRNTMSWPKQNYPHASTVNKRLEEHASGFDVFSPEIFGFFHICASCFRPVSIFCNPLLLCSRLTAYCW